MTGRDLAATKSELFMTKQVLATGLAAMETVATETAAAMDGEPALTK